MTGSNRLQALRLRLQGETYAQIAAELGRSRQRIQQLLSPPSVVRREVRHNAKYRCQDCRKKLRGYGHIHHKRHTGISLSEYSDISNLELLCASCHRKRHSGTLKKKGSAARRLCAQDIREIAALWGVGTFAFVMDKSPSTIRRWKKSDIAARNMRDDSCRRQLNNVLKRIRNVRSVNDLDKRQEGAA
jgi:hypothetical protein